jgi:hypothetical protein
MNILLVGVEAPDLRRPVCHRGIGESKLMAYVGAEDSPKPYEEPAVRPYAGYE